MKKIILGFIIVIACNACSKNNGTSVNTTQISIKNISGNYKGGPLAWANYAMITSGTDPNFTFTVTCLSNDMARVTITTIAPISIKIFDLSLTSKFESASSGDYGFTLSNTQNGITIQASLAVTLNSAYSPTAPAAYFAYAYYINYNHTEDLIGWGTRY